ncbi:MAG: glycosyltransferase, partial [Thermoguttaceae bacterium]|nr:glycosyltransferase [Thermoguttaceae bacterium]
MIPAYNEAPTLDALLRRVVEAPYAKQVIVVDDGSTDGTAEILKAWAERSGVEILIHPRNRGKGAAIRTALQAARGRFTLVQDADLEYDPADYPRLVEPLLAGQADAVYGSRRLGGQSRRWSVLGLGVSLLNVCVRLLYGVRITDEATCYKAFPTATLRAMDLRCERFEFCPEVTAKSCRMGLKIIEVPIRYHARTTREGKKLRWHDGIEALRTLWRWRRWEPQKAAYNIGGGAKAPIPAKETSPAVHMPQRRGDSRPASSRGVTSVLAILLAIHAALLGYGGCHDSMTWDEIGHLPAGISHWQRGEFSLYRVNPPLVRMVATIPVVLAGAKTYWGPRPTGIGVRPEFHPVGTEFLKLNGARSFRLLTLARWTCIPFSLLGAYVCFRWASELHGGAAGLVAATLWCFCPNVLAHGRLITPDVGAAALGLAAAYVYWRWLKSPSWSSAVVAGILLGLAELAKTTWIILFALWPLLWLAWNARRPVRLGGGGRLLEAAQLAAILAAGLVSINAGYGFEGSFRRLGEFRFCSRALANGGPDWRGNVYGNRFAGTWLAAMPVPLPENYLLGLDAQQWDFDRRQWSYLRGQWRLGGWWYYYLYALSVKVP